MEEKQITERNLHRPHDRLIHHINRSALMWSHDAIKFPEVYSNFHDAVLHCILSHHGRREWGSSVAPNSREAWLVHIADMMSARMDGYDKLAESCQTI